MKVIPLLIVLGIPLALFVRYSLLVYVPLVFAIARAYDRSMDERDLEVRKMASIATLKATITLLSLTFIASTVFGHFKELLAVAFLSSILGYWAFVNYYYSKMG
ncbi:hypothetical protein [Ignicoccus islandicus]|uniref:hypothetical protein n=1 Tax=Ignicoccus islandicus TaxID=54259 RepID=UPI0009464DC9|nr:hypothetical protein [Ignicoccus islandicus]